MFGAETGKVHAGPLPLSGPRDTLAWDHEGETHEDSPCFFRMISGINFIFKVYLYKCYKHTHKNVS